MDYALFERGEGSVARILGPFEARGTGTFASHKFVFASHDEPTVALAKFEATGAPNNLMPYDPYHVDGNEEQTRQNLAQLSENERQMYHKWRKTIRFNEEYKKVTGRAYLSAYPRASPSHFMWPADYFGQEHWVTTRETHFDALPPDVMMSPIVSQGKARRLEPHHPRLLHKYRTQESSSSTLNMTLKVISCAPRAFEIPNFLSAVEVQHILNVAAAEELKVSTTGDANRKEPQSHSTRSSRNSWLLRDKSPIIDAIYRRAADLLQIDEAMMRHRPDGELSDLPTTRPIVEQLQLVHYDVGQEYTAHHDFAYPSINDQFQQARYATLLLYLNEGMRGGETTFPRWSNAETFEQLRVVPQIGKAVLFYNILPDGNMDDLSQHEARKIRLGEKWLINLWVWDPFNTRSA